MNLLEIPRRLALVLALQVAACVYVVLGVGALVKIRQAGDQDAYLPVSTLALWIKARGWMLMVLPVAWYWFHVREWLKSGADWAFLARVVASGLAILGLLLLLALIGTLGIFRVRHFSWIDKSP